MALLASVMLLTAGTNLQGVLLPILRTQEGASMQQVGLLSSGWSFGFVLACLVVGRLVSSVGHVRSFAGLAAISGSAALLLPALNDQIAWVALRVVIGFCFGGLSLVIESWLNERSGTEQRASIFAAYMTVSLLASLGGTLSLRFLDPAQPLPYTLMGICVVLSIVPVALSRAPLPQPIAPFTVNLRTLWRVSPTGVFGCFAVGLVSGALGGLLPAYGLHTGMSAHQVASLLAATLIGGALAYYPAGALSDRMDRRIVIMALSFISAALCGVLVLQPHLPAGETFLLVGAFGFFQFPIYGICIARTNDWVRQQSFSEIASELLVVYGVGTVLGPLLAAVMMQRGTQYLFLFMGVVLAVLAVFTAVRMQVRSHAPRDQTSRSHPFEIAPNSMHVFRPRARPRDLEGSEP